MGSENSRSQVIITKAEKNPGLGAFLALAFGPIGLLYSDGKAALIMFAPTAISFALCSIIIGIPFFIACLVICGVWGYRSCNQYNKTIHGDLFRTQDTPDKAA